MIFCDNYIAYLDFSHFSPDSISYLTPVLKQKSTSFSVEQFVKHNNTDTSGRDQMKMKLRSSKKNQDCLIKNYINVTKWSSNLPCSGYAIMLGVFSFRRFDPVLSPDISLPILVQFSSRFCIFLYSVAFK